MCLGSSSRSIQDGFLSEDTVGLRAQTKLGLAMSAAEMPLAVLLAWLRYHKETLFLN